MRLRVLHTADWHLGHSLHDIEREPEHAAFLAWLLDTLVTREVDVLCVAGDIFDVANPSAGAQAQWYRFLADARTRVPGLDIIAIAGNHDSASRLEAPRSLLAGLGIQVVGRLPRTDAGALDLDRLVVAMHDRDGHVAGHCAAVPFLRPADLPRCPGADDELIAGVRQVYAEVITGLNARSRANQVRMALGHCYMTSSQLSTMSERRVLGGNQHALPLDLFDETLDYVGLGHLHLAQRLGGTQHIRYSGSPIPLSMSEAHYHHCVCIADFEDGRLTGVDTPAVPRAVELLRVPSRRAGPWPEVEAMLLALPDRHDEGPRPYLEVRVHLDAVDSGLRRKVNDCLDGRHARLVKLTVEHGGTGASLADRLAQRSLNELGVDEVFESLYRRHYDSEPDAQLMACFHEIREQVENGPGEQTSTPAATQDLAP